MAELDAGGVTHDTKEDTNFNGVADFTMEVLVSNITQTPLATVTFDDEDIYGNAFCTIHSATSDAFWAAVIERATNGK